MITEQALREAIAECQGEKNPNRDTCMMLAAFYIIQDRLYPQREQYSFAAPPDNIQSSGAEAIGSYGSSEFLQAIQGKSPEDVWPIMDELMDTLKIINERVYASIMRKIK